MKLVKLENFNCLYTYESKYVENDDSYTTKCFKSLQPNMFLIIIN